MSTPGMDRANLRTPLKQVLGLGSAKSGTHHFIVQRMTGLALVLLVIWVVGFTLTLVHAGDYAHARALLRQPLCAAGLVAFVVVSFWHAQLGLQVVIEDYVHTRWLEIASQIAVKFVCAGAALIGVIAIFRVHIGY
ncbi:MAG: succinate dehydrogenase, hydrophobic membrane anchor protein [Rudaea sp.]|uniref:succinate dehydrogenase, hydrophobic membrane anchor protein n=1 Tax=Rudaea sp. TaxID=2136325 RepID=UPI0039E43561